jgi:predicted AAA+ superfamily ATPase
VQRAPELLVAIQAAADRKRTPGRFLLTGSANVLLLPRVAESLAGRIEIVNLWPFSPGEIEGAVEGFIAAAFGDVPPVLGRLSSSVPRSA